MSKIYTMLLASLMLLVSPAMAASYELGKQYVKIEPQPAVAEGEHVEVTEFFMYSCPHCSQFEPALEKWAAGKPANIDLVRVPAMFGGSANMHAQAYYTLEAMGESERLHIPLFRAIHDEKKKLRTRDALDAFLKAKGVDMAKFRETWDSFSVAAKINRASALMRRYGIRGVPALVVDGRYRSGKGFRSYDEMTEVIGTMADRVLQERKAAGKN